MLGIVPPLDRRQQDDKGALSDSAEEREFNIDYGRNVRTSVPGYRRPKDWTTANMYQTYRDKLFDEKSL